MLAICAGQGRVWCTKWKMNLRWWAVILQWSLTILWYRELSISIWWSWSHVDSVSEGVDFRKALSRIKYLLYIYALCNTQSSMDSWILKWCPRWRLQKSKNFTGLFEIQIHFPLWTVHFDWIHWTVAFDPQCTVYLGLTQYSIDILESSGRVVTEVTGVCYWSIVDRCWGNGEPLSLLSLAWHEA